MRYRCQICGTVVSRFTFHMRGHFTNLEPEERRLRINYFRREHGLRNVR